MKTLKSTSSWKSLLPNVSVRHSLKDKILTCAFKNNVTTYTHSLGVSSFTFSQVFAEVHDGCHVTVNRGIRVGDGSLRLR